MINIRHDVIVWINSFLFALLIHIGGFLMLANTIVEARNNVAETTISLVEIPKQLLLEDTEVGDLVQSDQSVERAITAANDKEDLVKHSEPDETEAAQDNSRPVDAVITDAEIENLDTIADIDTALTDQEDGDTSSAPLKSETGTLQSLSAIAPDTSPALTAQPPNSDPILDGSSTKVANDNLPISSKESNETAIKTELTSESPIAQSSASNAVVERSAETPPPQTSLEPIRDQAILMRADQSRSHETLSGEIDRYQKPAASSTESDAIQLSSLNQQATARTANAADTQNPSTILSAEESRIPSLTQRLNRLNADTIKPEPTPDDQLGGRTIASKNIETEPLESEPLEKTNRLSGLAGENQEQILPSQSSVSELVEEMETALSLTSGKDNQQEEIISESNTDQDFALLRPTRESQRTQQPMFDVSQVSQLLKYLEENTTGGCAAVLPSLTPDGQVVLSGFAADVDIWREFKTKIDNELSSDIYMRASQVAPEQCRALTFARTVERYPRFSLGMTMDATELVSGSTLSGIIERIQGRSTHLLVIDDEGLVQTLDPFLQFEGSNARFSVPMTISGNPVKTAQMLIAIATPAPLGTVSRNRGQSAKTFFAILAEEAATRNLDLDLAISSFYLR